MLQAILGFLPYITKVVMYKNISFCFKIVYYLRFGQLVQPFVAKDRNCTTLKCSPVSLNITLVDLNSTPVSLK